MTLKMDFNLPKFSHPNMFLPLRCGFILLKRTWICPIFFKFLAYLLDCMACYCWKTLLNFLCFVFHFKQTTCLLIMFLSSFCIVFVYEYIRKRQLCEWWKFPYFIQYVFNPCTCYMYIGKKFNYSMFKIKWVEILLKNGTKENVFNFFLKH